MLRFIVCIQLLLQSQAVSLIIACFDFFSLYEILLIFSELRDIKNEILRIDLWYVKSDFVHYLCDNRLEILSRIVISNLTIKKVTCYNALTLFFGSE